MTYILLITFIAIWILIDPKKKDETYNQRKIKKQKETIKQLEETIEELQDEIKMIEDLK